MASLTASTSQIAIVRTLPLRTLPEPVHKMHDNDPSVNEEYPDPGRYIIATAGINCQGNEYCKHIYYYPGAVNHNTYHYRNKNGSSFYSLPYGRDSLQCMILGTVLWPTKQPIAGDLLEAW